MESLLDFMSHIVYGTGSDAVITPNHADWTGANPSPTGTQWLARFIDGPASMLGTYESWLRSNGQVPVHPWDGTDFSPWDTLDEANVGVGEPLPANLQPTSLSFVDETALGNALRSRLEALPQSGLDDIVRRPYIHWFWSYLKWSELTLRRYRGELVNFSPPILRDWDGTILSATPMLNFVNHAHWRWHDFDGAHGQPTGAAVTPNGAPTPGYRSSVGQRTTAASATGTTADQRREFLYFHRDHVGMYHRWLARTEQPEQPAINMISSWSGAFGDSTNTGFPPPGSGTPTTWTKADNPPWTNTLTDEAGDEDLRTNFANQAALAGNAMGTYHAEGHNINSDITHPLRNNINPRFFSWHVFLDDQWLLREPSFIRFDDSTGLRERIFHPVLAGTVTPWAGLSALTIVRDPAAGADQVSPVGALGGLDLETGTGTLTVQLEAHDTYGRPLNLELRGDVFDDTAGPAPVETVTETRTLGPTGDFALGTSFTVPLSFSGAFRSDDFDGLNPAVGFENTRIRITGILTPQAGVDGDFTHEDFIDVNLIQEKEEPAIEVYLNLSSFSEDQVTSRLAIGGAEARFRDAIIVTVQDRTAAPAPISWPTEVLPELRNLLAPPVPSSGLFDDPAHKPDVQLWRPAANTPFDMVSIEPEPGAGPILEDPSRPANLPQRFTYYYDVVFRPGHDAFAGLAASEAQFARLQVNAKDRSGNAALQELPIKLFRASNPYMVDGDPAWLSDDTRVLRVFEGETIFGVPLSSGPSAFIQALLNRLRDGGIPEADRVAFFESLPTFNGQDQLQYSTQITNPSTGVTQNIYNFALARVRNQSNAATTQVRAFFRLFSYTAANLVFDDGSGDPDVGGYRTNTAGTTRVPLLGYSASGETISIPFFAVPRTAYTNDMRTQPEDTPNVFSFAGGTNAEQLTFAGAWLDINQASAQLPASRGSAPDGPFTVGAVQPIRTLIHDAHQCMVCEIVYDPDPTQVGDRPSTSDNLAQRNLTILTSDNPGNELTRTLQHSFDADLSRQVILELEVDGQLPAVTLSVVPPQIEFVGTEEDGRRRKLQTVMPDHFMQHDAMHPPRDPATAVLPSEVLLFNSVDWPTTGQAADELMINWNGLPEESEVTMFMPSVDARTVINLRNVRHAPRDVWVLDEHTLRLKPSGITWVPLPPNPEGRINGTITIQLPKGVKAGQRWRVDVQQTRGFTRQTLGAFSLDVRVEADRVALAITERRLLGHLFERRSLMPATSRWRPILDQRVEHSRARAEALHRRAGLEWIDPTGWIDPTDPSGGGELLGPALRVVLDKIEIRKDYDPLFKGRGEIVFRVKVTSADNGGQEAITRLPANGVFKVSDKPGTNVINLGKTVFSGHAQTDLRLEVVGTEHDLFDPDDWIGRFTRVFCGDPETWFEQYSPDDTGKGNIVPEDIGPWRIWYRIERGLGG